MASSSTSMKDPSLRSSTVVDHPPAHQLPREVDVTDAHAQGGADQPVVDVGVEEAPGTLAGPVEAVGRHQVRVVDAQQPDRLAHLPEVERQVGIGVEHQVTGRGGQPGADAAAQRPVVRVVDHDDVRSSADSSSAIAAVASVEASSTSTTSKLATTPSATRSSPLATTAATQRPMVRSSFQQGTTNESVSPAALASATVGSVGEGRARSPAVGGPVGVRRRGAPGRRSGPGAAAPGPGGTGGGPPPPPRCGPGAGGPAPRGARRSRPRGRAPAGPRPG